MRSSLDRHIDEILEASRRKKKRPRWRVGAGYCRLGWPFPFFLEVVFFEWFEFTFNLEVWRFNVYFGRTREGVRSAR